PRDDQRKSRVVGVKVNLVLQSLAVSDTKGPSVPGPRPPASDIYEDNIPQKIASFAEGNEPQRALDTTAGRDPTRERVASTLGGANVFILFDTSNYMYRGFALAQDAIADFVRSLDSPKRAAFYAYSP